MLGLGDKSVANNSIFSVKNLSIVCNNNQNHITFQISLTYIIMMRYHDSLVQYNLFEITIVGQACTFINCREIVAAYAQG